jgi:chromosomal replication initiation ATPase DnaA
MTATPQLPLPFAHVPHYSRADFLWAPSNETARVFLAQGDAWPQNRLALWGEAGSGKTHLLHLWAGTSGAALIAGPSLTEVPEAKPFAVDDADRCPVPTALLHLLNRCAEAGAPVLLAARQPPSRWPVALPDLASRLRAVTAVEIAAPEDGLLRALLARLLADRQLVLAEELQAWLLLRLPRTAEAVREAVARLDYAALAAGRRPGRALVAAVVQAASDGEATDQIMSMPEKSAGVAELR